MPLDFWARFNAEPQVVSRLRLGELLDGDVAEVARVWREGGFTTMFDFPLAFAMADVFCRRDSVAKLAAVLTSDRLYPDASALVTLVDNHDLPRIKSVCGGDEARVAEALTFLLAARGVPSIIWGTEVGFEGEKEPDNRASMRFVSHPFRALISGWMAARRAHPSLRDGVSLVLEARPDALVLARLVGTEASVVYVNHTDGPLQPTPLEGQTVADVEPVPAGVTVRTFAGDFTALARLAAERASGRRLRDVVIEGQGAIVGSGPELGFWRPASAVPLPATLRLPEGGVFEFKRVTAEADALRWEDGPNRLLVVGAGDAPLRLSLD